MAAKPTATLPIKHSPPGYWRTFIVQWHGLWNVPNLTAILRTRFEELMGHS